MKSLCRPTSVFCQGLWQIPFYAFVISYENIYQERESLSEGVVCAETVSYEWDKLVKVGKEKLDAYELNIGPVSQSSRDRLGGQERGVSGGGGQFGTPGGGHGESQTAESQPKASAGKGGEQVSTLV